MAGLNEILARHFVGITGFSIDADPAVPLNTLAWEAKSDGSQRFRFAAGLKDLPDSWMYTLLTRFIATLKIADRYDPTTRRTGTALIDVGDWSDGPALCFSDSRPDALLIPDSSFLESNGYEFARPWGSEGIAPNWEDRLPVALWRGSSTGVATRSLMDIPRARLCALGQGSALLDAGITAVVQASTPDEEQAFLASGLCKSHVPMERHAQYKYQIDIDGNTNSWPGLFQKLLTGSPVLKILSPQHYKQWYYSRLIPWLNYVPVASDLSDLLSKIEYLRMHDELAREIGRRGRELALDMTCAREVERSLPTVEAAFGLYAFTRDHGHRVGSIPPTKQIEPETATITEIESGSDPTNYLGLLVPIHFYSSVELAISGVDAIENKITLDQPQPALVGMPADFDPRQFSGEWNLVFDFIGVAHYFHFLEAFIWVLAIQHRYFSNKPMRRIIFPVSFWDNPHQNNVQSKMIDIVYPGVEIIAGGDGTPERLQNLVYLNRMLCKTDINKFLEHAQAFAAPSLRAFCEQVRKANQVAPQARPITRRPRVIYVKRHPPRCLSAESEAKLLAWLDARFQLQTADFAQMSWSEQVVASASSDVMIGVHGNGLTNLLWIEPGGVVIELFPDGFHQYDYQMYSELAGLHYYGLEGDRIHRDHGRDGPNRGGQVEGNVLIEDLHWQSLETIFDSMSGVLFPTIAV